MKILNQANGMKQKKLNHYKQVGIVLVCCVLQGYNSLSSVAQTNKSIGKNTNKSSVLLGYYPANYQQASTTASLTVHNQFIGLGNNLCVWLNGDFNGETSLRGTKQSPADSVSSDSYRNPLNDQKLLITTIAPQFTATITNDSTFTKNISTIYMQYYPIQKATALYIPMPEDGVLYNAYQVHINHNNKPIATVKKLYLVPNYTLPELVSSTNEIKINNANKLTGGQAPFQYYWMEYSNGKGKMVSSGSIDALSKLPTISTEDKDATYSLMIKDANYLVSNQYISTKASNLPSVGILTNRNIKVNIYPNPTTTELYIQFDPSLRGTKQSLNESQQLVYSITDLQGKELLKGTLNTADLKTIAVQALAQGTYMLSISSSKDSSLLYQNKFVKL